MYGKLDTTNIFSKHIWFLQSGDHLKTVGSNHCLQIKTISNFKRTLQPFYSYVCWVIIVNLHTIYWPQGLAHGQCL